MFSRSFINTFRGQATRSAATLGRATAPRAMLWAAGAAGALAVTATVARPTPIHLEGPVTIAGEAKTVKERSYVMIKPDGTARQLVGEIISTFEKRGYKLVGLKAVVPSEELAKEYVFLLGHPLPSPSPLPLPLLSHRLTTVLCLEVGGGGTAEARKNTNWIVTLNHTGITRTCRQSHSTLRWYRTSLRVYPW